LFKVAVLFFYESALEAKGLENDRERSSRRREWLRAFLQERSLTKLAADASDVFSLVSQSTLFCRGLVDGLYHAASHT